MFFRLGRLHEYVVQKDEDEPVQVIPQEIVHHIHEFLGGIGKPKWHYQVLKETPPRFKCCLLNASGPNRYLPIP